MSFLDPYGLPQDAFAPQQLRRQAPQLPTFEPVSIPAPMARPPVPDFGGQISGLAKMMQKATGADEDPLDKITALLKRIPRRPDVWDEQPPTKTAVRASTPLEAPDTGEVNPNVGYPIPAGYFSKLGRRESSHNPRATNEVTGAAGRFQFLGPTYAGIRKEAPWLDLSDDIYDDTNQAKAADYYTRKSLAILTPMLGRQPTMGELYAAHFLGHAGGPRLLRNLDAPAGESVDPAAVAANPWLRAYLKRPGRDLLAAFDRMME